MQARKKVSKKDLEKLAAFADMNLYAIDYLPPEYLPDEEREQLASSFAMAHYYFIQLTLDALEDKKFAEWLIPIFERLERQMIKYTDSFGVLSNILQLKHGIKEELPPPASAEEIRNRSERLAQRMEYKTVIGGHERLRERERQVLEGDRNIMFG